MRALVIGDITQDKFLSLDPSDVDLRCNLNSTDCEICFHYSDKIPVKSVVESLGGNAANVSVAMAKLALPVSIASQVIDDQSGQKIKDLLDEKGVDTTLLKMVSGESNNFSIVISYRGERTIFSYHQPQKYQLDLSGEYPLIYLTSLGDDFHKVYDDVIKNHTKSKLVFQPGTIQLKAGLSAIKSVVERADILLLNNEEAGQLLQKQAEPRSLLDDLLGLGAKEVVVTAGKQGAYLTNGEQYVHIGIWEAAPTKDSTGVGDAFSATYTALRWQQIDLVEAAKWAVINAGSVVQQVGAQNGLLSFSQLQHKSAEIDIKLNDI